MKIVCVSDAEVRSASYGRVTRYVGHDSPNWYDQQDTLHDPKIFGLDRPLECACGRYQGEEHKGMICEVCRVKVTGNHVAVRRKRFGHILLPDQVRHPFDETRSLGVIPVLPIGLRKDSNDTDLDRLYVNLLQAISEWQESADSYVNRRRAELQSAVHALFDNERLEKPVTFSRRVLRSLASHLREGEQDLSRVGIFLWAMALRVEIS